MNLAFDNTAQNIDNVETEGLLPIFQEFVDELVDHIDGNVGEPDIIEFRHRDGFIPSRYNKGGIDFISYNTVAGMIGSGAHMGTWIEQKIEELYNNDYDETKKENPNLTEEQLFDLVYERNDDDYSGVAYRVRVMYEGDNKVAIHYGFDFDAPYYRWGGNDIKTIEINFKNKSDLKRKLKAVHGKIYKNIDKPVTPTK
jgi:hypothetical protein